MEVIEKEIGHVIEIEEYISMMQIPKVMGKNYSDIIEYLGGCDVKTNENTMPYARYINIDWERQVTRSRVGNFIDVFTKKWHFFTGVPSTIKLDDKDRLKTSKIEKRKYLKIMHYGPYQKVGDTYKNMWKNAQENNLKLDNTSFEFYLNDPTAVSKDKIETEVLIPLK